MRKYGYFAGVLGVSLAISGCGRIGFDSQAAADQDASAEGPDATPGLDASGLLDASLADDASTVPQPDAAPMAVDPWDGNFTMGTPAKIPELNFPGNQIDCSFSPDGLTMYFSDNPNFVLGGQDLFFVTRPSLGGAFATPPVHQSALSSTGHDGLLYSHDQLEAFFSSNRNGSLNLWKVSRANTAVPWDGTDAVELTALSAGGANHDPWVSADGLRLYWNSARAGGLGSHDIYTASRASTADAFGAPTSVGGLNTASVDANISLSNDELFAVFTSNRVNGGNDFDLFFSKRAAIGDAFDAPVALANLNTTDEDWEPCLSPDGFLYFSSARPGTEGGSDFFRAEFLPE